MAALSTCTLSTSVLQASNAKTPDLQMLGYSRRPLVSSPPTPPLERGEHYAVPTNRNIVNLNSEHPGMAFSSSPNAARHAYSIDSTTTRRQPAPPVVLVIHGAWHTPTYYFPLLHALTTAGFMTLCPQLPSCSNVLPPPCSLSDDVNMIRNLAMDLAGRGHPIIAIMHSYGGVVGTEALVGLGWHVRQGASAKKGQDPDNSIGGIVALIYMTAFMLPIGFSLATPFGGKLPPFMTEHSDGTCSMNDPYLRFFSTDVTEGQAETPNTLSIPSALPCISPSFLLTHLTNHPASAQTTSVTRAAYLDSGMSTTYLVCEKDVALAPEAQRGMIHLARGNGVDVYEETCEGGHSPFLSVPEDIAMVVRRAWIRWATVRGSTEPEHEEVNGQLQKIAGVDQETKVDSSTVAHTISHAAHSVGNPEAMEIEVISVAPAHSNSFGEVNDEVKHAQIVGNDEAQVDLTGDAQGSLIAQVQGNELGEVLEEMRDEIQIDVAQAPKAEDAPQAKDDATKEIEETQLFEQDKSLVVDTDKSKDFHPLPTEEALNKNTKDLLEPKPDGIPPASIASVLPKSEGPTTTVSSAIPSETDDHHGSNGVARSSQISASAKQPQSQIHTSDSQTFPKFLTGIEAPLAIAGLLNSNTDAAANDYVAAREDQLRVISDEKSQIGFLHEVVDPEHAVVNGVVNGVISSDEVAGGKIGKMGEGA